MQFIKKIYKHNPLRFITYTTVGIVCAIPMIALLYIFIITASNNFDLNSIYFSGVRPTLIITNSMEPTIMTNSIIMVEDIEFEDIEPGDIIRYNSARGFSIVHRVVAKGDGYFITKGDNNSAVDNELITPDIINGRVKEIHNEYAPILTLFIGKFDMQNIPKSIFRFISAFIIAALIVTFIALGIYYIFEIISINIAWCKHSDKMTDSTDWMDDRVSRNEFNQIIAEYKGLLKKSNIFKKLVLVIYFRKCYDVMCTEEQKAKRTSKYMRRLEKLLNSWGK